MRSLPLLCLLLGSSACAHPNEPTRALTVEFEFRVAKVANAPPFRAEGGEAVIVIGGTFEALCIPYRASAFATRDGGAVELRVVGRPSADGCFDAIEDVLYSAEIRGFSAGQYSLRIIHEWAETGRSSELVFERVVSVQQTRHGYEEPPSQPDEN